MLERSVVPWGSCWRRGSPWVLLQLIALTAIPGCAAEPGTEIEKPAPSTSSPSPTVAVPAPPTLVAVTGDGRIAVIATETGEVVRYLTEAQPGGGPADLALTADRGTLYFNRKTGASAAHLASLPVSGDQPATAVSTSGHGAFQTVPKPRPGRSQLAFIRGSTAADPRTVLVIADLEGTRMEHVYPNRGGWLAWSADGRLLATADNAGALVVLTVDESGAVTRSQPLLPPPYPCSWGGPAFSPTSGLLVVEQACPAPDVHSSLVQVEPETGAPRGNLFHLPRGMSFWSNPSFDTSGHHVLFSASSAKQPAKRLYRLQVDEGELVKIGTASGYKDPVW